MQQSDTRNCGLTSTYSCTHPYTPSFIHISIHPFIHTLIHPFTRPFKHKNIHSHIHSPIYLHICSPIHTPIHTHIHSLIHPRINWPIDTHIHSPLQTQMPSQTASWSGVAVRRQGLNTSPGGSSNLLVARPLDTFWAPSAFNSCSNRIIRSDTALILSAYFDLISFVINSLLLCSYSDVFTVL